MGMYSYFYDEEIDVLDWKGLKLFFKEWDKYRKSQEGYKNNYNTKEKMILKNDDGKEYLTFGSWTDLKIISYWYDEELLFLTLIAPYIEGRVEWDFESKDESGSASFEDGKCSIETGQMSYENWEAKKQIRKDFPKQLKKLMILGELK